MAVNGIANGGDCNTYALIPGEVVNKTLGRYVTLGFQKKGLRNWFSTLKMGSTEQTFANICVSGGKILAKIGFEMQDFFQEIQVGFLGLENGLKKWVSGAKKWGS